MQQVSWTAADFPKMGMELSISPFCLHSVSQVVTEQDPAENGTKARAVPYYFQRGVS
jgi:hypothetical protein